MTVPINSAVEQIISPKTFAVRIAGLDTLRALAIVLVLFSHYSAAVSKTATFGLLSDWGWIGVDLFFVLSGYLIGSQLLAPLVRGEYFSLLQFFARRLLRTLPNYYVILGLYFLLPQQLAGSATAQLWQFLTFTQNFSFSSWGQTFSHSWSLCIEEQFYLLLPLVLLAIVRLRRPVAVGWVLVLALFALCSLLRVGYWLQMDPSSHGAPFYYASFTRFDELLPGLMIAMLQHCHPALFDKLRAFSNGLILAGVVLLLLVMAWLGNMVPDTVTAAAVAYPLLALCFAMLVLSCLAPASCLNRYRIPGTNRLALWSYAIYLAHKPIFSLMVQPVRAMGLLLGSPAAIVMIMTAGIAGGWLLFHCVESPFMRLRARFFANKHT